MENKEEKEEKQEKVEKQETRKRGRPRGKASPGLSLDRRLKILSKIATTKGQDPTVIIQACKEITALLNDKVKEAEESIPSTIIKFEPPKIEKPEKVEKAEKIQEKVVEKIPEKAPEKIPENNSKNNCKKIEEKEEIKKELVENNSVSTTTTTTISPVDTIVIDTSEPENTLSFNFSVEKEQ